MKRRNFLGMLGLSPLVAATAKLAPQLFWEGTTIPRAMPMPVDAWKEIAESEARVQALTGAIDPVIAKVAEELGYRAGLATRELTICRNPQHIHDWASGSDCLA